MKQAGTERISGLTTAEDHRFKIGQIELTIPAGTVINECLDDVSLFGSMASDLLVEQVREVSTDDPLDPNAVWCATYLMQLSMAMSNAAHNGLLKAGVLR